jgi:Outer membrane protein beta-barrel domain
MPFSADRAPRTPHIEVIMLRTLPSSLLTVAVSAIVVAVPVHAQESTTRGFNVGIHATGASLKPQDGDRSNAGGGGLFFGYGFNRNFELFLQLDGAQFDVQNADVNGTWTMGHGDLGFRYYFANSLRTWVPYVQAAFTGRAVSVKDAEVNQVAQSNTVSFTGGALTLGGGVIFYFNQKLGLDLQLAWSGGKFTQYKTDNATYDLSSPLDAQSSRFNVGLSWWP